jgi:competence protein ComGC
MVRYSKTAFTLIELIFSIFIISIAIFSLPMVSNLNLKNLQNNIYQEAIFIASSQLKEASSFKWDQFSNNDINITQLSRVINTDTDGCDFSNNRLGNINRRCLEDLSIRPSDTAGVNNLSLDSLSYSSPRTVFINKNISASSYKNDYNSTLVIKRCIDIGDCIPFGNELKNRNIKQLEFKIIKPDGEVLILFRGYSTNIGEVEIFGKLL